jgi:hypothetical protein
MPGTVFSVLVASAVLTIASAATPPTAASATTATSATPATTAATTTVTSAVAATTTTASTTARAAARAAIERRHVFGLRSLLTLAHFKLDLLSFLEFAKAPALDRGEVHEAIFSAVVRRDEPIALLGIEPLHYPCRAHRALSPCVSTAVCS